MKKSIILISIFILLSGCNNNSEETVESLWTKSLQYRSINNLKDSITILKNIINNYPDNEYAAKSQFQIADIYLNDVKDYSFAIYEFDKVIKNYPKNTLSRKALFMKAYINSNYIEAYSDAIEEYENFLSKYPDDELVPSVEFELQILSKYRQVIDSLIINRQNLRSPND